MTPLPSSVILDIVRSELSTKQRRAASRALRKIASVVVFYDDESNPNRVLLVPYINEEMTGIQEAVVLRIEEILMRNIDRLLDEIEKREDA